MGTLNGDYGAPDIGPRSYRDRGHPARLNQQVHFGRLSDNGVDKVAFNESGRDARGPSKSGPLESAGF
jgi:hypothetical protein